jgi:hypothetical protein
LRRIAEPSPEKPEPTIAMRWCSGGDGEGSSREVSEGELWLVDVIDLITLVTTR